MQGGGQSRTTGAEGTGLHKRASEQEDRGGGRRGRAAPILDGPGDVPPKTSCQKPSVTEGVRSRPKAAAPGGRKGRMRPRRGPQRSAARKHAVAVRRGAK